MTERVTYEIPAEFSDEDRWLKFFTKPQALCLSASVLISILLTKMLALISLTVIGIIIGILLVIATLIITMGKMPEANYLRGGGLYFDTILARKFIRKKKRCIYVKGYGESVEVKRK